MDDERIKQLTAEVMGSLSSADTVSLEDRVAALEKAVRVSVSIPVPVAVPPVSVQAVSLSVHPSQSLLGPSAPPGGRCVMEPDKPCVQSGMCRTLGH